MTSDRRTPCLVLVEENLADVRLLKRVCQELYFHPDLSTVARERRNKADDEL